jgi:divalent metal cation (Fe/Co/Zn/Cd) transporter
VGEAADAAMVAGIQELAHQDPAVRQIRSPLTMQFGPNEILLTMDVEFRDDLNTTQLARAVDRLVKNIRGKYPAIRRIYIESELIGKQIEQASNA